MKRIILTSIFLAVTLTGCNKQSDPATVDPKENSTAKAQFENSDDAIGVYLDQLDDPNTTHDERTQILCKDYLVEYKSNYMPALLKLSPEYTEKLLLADLNQALDYYKEKDNIRC